MQAAAAAEYVAEVPVAGQQVRHQTALSSCGLRWFYVCRRCGR